MKRWQRARNAMVAVNVSAFSAMGQASVMMANHAITARAKNDRPVLSAMALGNRPTRRVQSVSHFPWYTLAMDYMAITEPAPIDGDTEKFAESAFKLAQIVVENGDIDTPKELREFLLAEAEENERRAAYQRRMGKYFHENTAVSRDMEAKAFRLMASRIEQ